VVYIECKLGKQIKPEGWDNWGNAANEKTVMFAEYKNYGEGNQPKARVPWSKQLSPEEAGEYTKEKIFGDWKPL
jgi:pectinesterase